MSRYPAPSQMRTAYDRSLVTTAPTPTRAERQAGYDVNALEQGEYYVSNARPKPPPPAPAVNPFADQAVDYQQYQQQPASYSPAPSPDPYREEPKEPFYKTKKGRLLIGLAIIVFIGIITGIAAGAAAARQSKNTTLIGNDSQDLNNPPSISSSVPSLTPSQINEPASPSSTPASIQGQDPAATFGNGNGNGNVSPISQEPTGSSNQGTTLVFGGTPQPSSGTNSGSGSSGGFSGNPPPGCYLTPLSRSCCPYFFDNC